MIAVGRPRTVKPDRELTSGAVFDALSIYRHLKANSHPSRQTSG